MSIILYSTNCPRCIQLEKKLISKNVPFIICNDIGEMQRLGIMSAPVLSVDSELMPFAQAWKWVDNYNVN